MKFGFVSSKAQSEIIGAIMIAVVSIGLVAVVYTWGLPLIQKRQDTAVSDRVDSGFDQNNINSLPSKIEAIANSKGEATFNLDVNGLWTFNEEEDSLSFTFFTKVSKVATNLQSNPWVSLTTNANCNSLPIAVGILGVDKPSVICTRGDTFETGYNVVYKVYFRQLNPATSGTSYKIDLLKHESGSLSSTGKSVRIIFDDKKEQAVGQQTLIISQVKILFV